jgi:putative NIF3 family GTP cyclohydrolase 1 type 2
VAVASRAARVPSALPSCMRRQVLRGVALVLAFVPLARDVGAQQLTAGDVIARIQANVGVPWGRPTVDTIKAGDATTPVRCVAVTMMATLDVLQRAAKDGCNLVITHEPTFFDHLDNTALLVQEQDPVTSAKLRFIAEHRMVVWRFHDHQHRMRPDMVLAALPRALGWPAPADSARPWRITLPATTLGAVASRVRERLGANAVRIVGDPALPVTTVAIAPGAAGFAAHRRALQDPGVQLLVLGEAREWETVEYVDDAIAAGMAKGLVIIGHIPSEQVGMEEAARWIGTFVREVPVRFVPARDPFRPVR